jgi:hypothetical protein
MGDNTDAPAAVTAGELAAVLQAMDEKYRSLFDAISKQAGSSKSEIELKEEVHPLQMPHVKLEGSETYVSWAEHAETILVSRKLEGYILGTIEKPAEESSKEAQRWRTANALVRAWLLSFCHLKLPNKLRESRKQQKYGDYSRVPIQGLEMRCWLAKFRKSCKICVKVINLLLSMFPS